MSSFISRAGFAFEYIWRLLQKSVEIFWTLFYHGMLKRTTTEPLKDLGREGNPDNPSSREVTDKKQREPVHTSCCVTYFIPAVGFLADFILYIGNVMPPTEHYTNESLVRTGYVLL